MKYQARTLFLGLLISLFIPLLLSAQDGPFDKVFAYRESARDGNSVKVQILVNLKGLAKGKTVKMKEKIPAGYTAKVTDAYGSVSEVTETNVSFVWKVLPQSDLFIVKYELIYPGPVNENVTISGNMSFMSDFGIKYVSVVDRGFMTDKDLIYSIKNIPPYQKAAVVMDEEEPVVKKQEPVVVTGGTELSENSPKPKPRSDVVETKPEPVKTTVTEKPQPKPEPVVVKEEPKPEPVVVKEEPKPEPVVKKEEPKPEPVVVKEEPKQEPASSGGTIATSTGALYSVQVGASPEKLKANHFDKYSFDRQVEENLENGMYKYLLGRFSTLKDANAYLAKVKAKGVACFVVAYIDGKRVTVKEALDITKK